MFEDASKSNSKSTSGSQATKTGTPPQPEITSTQHSGLMLKLVDGEPVPRVLGRGIRIQLVLKRIFDIAFSLTGLIILGPSLLILAAIIKLNSRGPALFRHIRAGQGGKSIAVLKFRSMYADHCDANSGEQICSGDPRITPIGQFLRSNSFDELPQLINVLKGEMSVIGPRPLAPNMVVQGVPHDHLVSGYAQRFALKPGITGWAQANGLRGPAFDEERATARIHHDLAYIQNFSLGLDLWIIVLTARRELTFLRKR